MLELSPILITPPAAELITLDEARRQVRRDDEDDDAVITSLIAAVMSRLDGVDGILGRALITQEWSVAFDGFPVGAALCLPLAKVISIGSIVYRDRDNVEQTFAGANYTAHNTAKTAYVKLDTNSAWPATYTRDDAVTVTGQFGYGATADKVPAAIRHAGLMLLAHYYENREAVLVGTISSELPQGVMSLLRPFIRPHF